MREADWLRAADPGPMLEFLRGKSSDRKQCLFDAACCRRIWHLVSDSHLKEAVELLERYADDETLWEELSRANARVDAILTTRYGRRSLECHREAAWAVFWATMKPCEDDESGSRAAAGAVAASVKRARSDARAIERAAQASILRDLFGPLPFRPVAFDPAWRTATVVGLAQRAYGERQLPQGTLDPKLLVVLAHALEETGADAELWGHLRQEGAAHWRGCWVVDLLLEKEGSAQ